MLFTRAQYFFISFPVMLFCSILLHLLSCYAFPFFYQGISSTAEWMCLNSTPKMDLIRFRVQLVISLFLTGLKNFYNPFSLRHAQGNGMPQVGGLIVCQARHLNLAINQVKDNVFAEPEALRLDSPLGPM